MPISRWIALRKPDPAFAPGCVPSSSICAKTICADRGWKHYRSSCSAAGAASIRCRFPTPPRNPTKPRRPAETHRLILAAIAQLSPANRNAVLLYYFEQLSVRETAALLQISVPAVKGRLHKSRRKLRDQLRSTFAEWQQKPAAAQQTRSNQLIPVTVLDIVKPEPEKDHRILVLTDESLRRLLAIWIGPYEADDIALSLRGTKLHRPMTFTFMADMLDKAGVQIKSVTVSALEKEVFYATVHAQHGEDSFTIDARPSDAIALALRSKTPVFTAPEVMEAVGMDIPADMEVVQGKGISDVLSIDPEEKERRQKQREKWESMSPEERSKESHEKLLTHLTESGTLSQRDESDDE